MNAVDNIMLDESLPDIMAQLNPTLKFQALLIKKRVLHRDSVDEVFDGKDQEEMAFKFVKFVRKESVADGGRLIEALEESGQTELANTLKTNRNTAIETLRRGVKDALKLGSESRDEEGGVAVDGELFMDKCRAFSRAESHEVPGPLQYTDSAKTLHCISRDCADKLIRLLGGKIEVTVARRHGDLCLVRPSSGEVVWFIITYIVKSDGEDVVRSQWARPNDSLRFGIKHFVGDCKKVTDASGQDVDVSQETKDWWPTAPVGSSGDKELHVWRTEPPRRHDITPLKL